MRVAVEAIHRHDFFGVRVRLLLIEIETKIMTSTDQDRWTRVKERLRAEVGEDVYVSWFARIELDGSEGETVKLSVRWLGIA